jgi:hypothetical protein
MTGSARQLRRADQGGRQVYEVLTFPEAGQSIFKALDRPLILGTLHGQAAEQVIAQRDILVPSVPRAHRTVSESQHFRDVASPGARQEFSPPDSAYRV